MNKKISLKIGCIICFAVFMLIFCFSQSLSVFAKSYLNINYAHCSGKSMVVMETQNNTVLYSKNMKEKLPMASTTKIVTALTVIEHCEDLDKIISVFNVS